MNYSLTPEDQKKIFRIANEPFYWLRENFPEVKDWEDELSDLIDVIKITWTESRKYRIPIAFILELTTNSEKYVLCTINDYMKLQKEQQAKNSSLMFVIDLHGNVLEKIDMKDEIEPVSVKTYSQLRQTMIFWLGSSLEIYCRGFTWDPRDKKEVLKSIKTKQRTNLLSMNDYKNVLDTQFEQCIRGEAVAIYWVNGKKNQVLQPKPEKIFQKNLCFFLNTEVDCIQADMEPMFKDGSRCDIRVFVDNFDLYFIEIKWIGYCARQLRDKEEYTAESPTELKPDYAIGGAYQTKTYIENNNSIEYDHRIRLGIFLVYDAYPKPMTPLDYGKEIEEFPLLATVEYQLASMSPSKKGKKLAKHEGII